MNITTEQLLSKIGLLVVELDVLRSALADSKTELERLQAQQAESAKPTENAS